MQCICGTGRFAKGGFLKKSVFGHHHGGSIFFLDAVLFLNRCLKPKCQEDAGVNGLASCPTVDRLVVDVKLREVEVADIRPNATDLMLLGDQLVQAYVSEFVLVAFGSVETN